MTNAKSTTYNLINYSRIHVTKTLTEKPSYGFCVKSNNNNNEFKCNGEVIDANGKRIGNNNEVMMQGVIQDGQNWKLQFDRSTRGIDIVVVFAKVSKERNYDFRFRSTDLKSATENHSTHHDFSILQMSIIKVKFNHGDCIYIHKDQLRNFKMAEDTNALI